MHYENTITLGQIAHALFVCGFIYCLDLKGMAKLRDIERKLDEVMLYMRNSGKQPEIDVP